MSTVSPLPTLRWMLSSPVRCLALGLGSGLIRPGPGTWGTLLAWLLWIGATAALHAWYPPDWGTGGPLLGAAVLVTGFVVGAWACQRTGQALGQADHACIVWDEMLAFWLLLWLLPSGWAIQTAAFVLFRVYDITKPAPIRALDTRFKNGWGVMADDVLAAVYAGLTVVAGLWAWEWLRRWE